MDTVSSPDKAPRMADVIDQVRQCLAAGELVRIPPKGTSMLPMLRQGIDSVILAPVPGKLRKYDLPLYQRSDGQFVLHRIVKVRDTYTCVGDNQFHLEEGLQHDQMIAVVTSFYRGDKHYSVEHFGYRLYCRFWHYSRFPRRCWRWAKRQLGRLFR